MSWQLEMGATVLDVGRVRFSVWAPAARRVEVEVYPWPESLERHEMSPEGDGVWSATVEASAGWLYRYRLDGEWSYPDPYSRAQAEGVHGPSQIVDPNAFAWTDSGWPGLDPASLVIYELHVGAYTPEGTFDALIEQLDWLRDLGVTAVELMPVAEFPGRRGWGYDGVDLYAPASDYGGPEALRRLVDAAHARGLGVILDVVYNHLGPDGNYLRKFSRDYFTSRYQTPWGDALNFDGEGSRSVRRYVIDNALYWLHEFHVDGLRLDAVHHMHDASETHILAGLRDAVDAQGLPGRRFLLIAEEDKNDLRAVEPREEGGYGFDGIWVDDFHHSLHLLLTNADRQFLTGYEGTVEEVARLLQHGVLHHAPLDADTGRLAAVPPVRYVYSLQNHDQVGNRPRGWRLYHDIGFERYKALTALLLLSPGTPLLFMGDEYAASTPFLYFADLPPKLAAEVRAGRYLAFRDLWLSERAPDPLDDETFARSRLDLSERERAPHDGVARLHRELLRLRREDPVLRHQDRSQLAVETAGDGALVVRRAHGDERRLLIINFAASLRPDLAATAALADAARVEWQPVLSTAEGRFAGPGVELSTLALRPGRAVDVPAGSATLWEG